MAEPMIDEKKDQEPGIEESFEVLNAIIEKLENRDTTLEESFQIYKQGMDLIHSCSRKIDKVEKKMMQVNEDGELVEF